METHQPHILRLVTCAGCRDLVSIEFGTCYAFGQHALCYECATRLGGRFDVWNGRWSMPPEVSLQMLESNLRSYTSSLKAVREPALDARGLRHYRWWQRSMRVK